jgi:hypothetical protein
VHLNCPTVKNAHFINVGVVKDSSATNNTGIIGHRLSDQFDDYINLKAMSDPDMLRAPIAVLIIGMVLLEIAVAIGSHLYKKLFVTTLRNDDPPPDDILDFLLQETAATS